MDFSPGQLVFIKRCLKRDVYHAYMLICKSEETENSENLIKWVLISAKLFLSHIKRVIGGDSQVAYDPLAGIELIFGSSVLWRASLIHTCPPDQKGLNTII